MNDNKQLITAGIGLKPDHFDQALTSVEAGLWFEVHTENYFITGGQRLEKLRFIGQRFPISFHGVGASLGGPALPDAHHLARVKQLADQFQPEFVSEHAVWSRLGDQYFAVTPVWQKLKETGRLNTAIEVIKQPEYILLWRQHSEVLIRPLTSVEFKFLSGLDTGLNLGEAAEIAVLDDSDFNLSVFFSNLITAGLLATTQKLVRED